MKKKWTLYSKDWGSYQSSEPGRFAAITTQKVAGRLDCHSGKRAKPENRIFLRYLEDMPKGFRVCRICKPEVLRVGDRLDHLEERADVLEHEPHISLWATGMVRKDDTYEPCRWYVAMNWRRKARKRLFYAQQTLSKHHRYHKAFSLVLKEGRRLNIPVIKHTVVNLVVLWLPTRGSTAEQKELVASMKSGKVLSVFSNGIIEIESSFS